MSLVEDIALGSVGAPSGSRTSVRIEFLSDGFRQLLCSDEVKELVSSLASDIETKANKNASPFWQYKSTVWKGAFGGGRWVGSVSAKKPTHKAAEEGDAILLGAVGK